MNESVLSVAGLRVQHFGETIFEGLNFELKPGEQWALVGESGSGKTALLQTIAGRFNITGGSIVHHYFEHLPAPEKAKLFGHQQLIALVGAKHGLRNLSHTADFYYQQRFNALDADDAPTVTEYLSSIKPLVPGREVWTYTETLEKLRLWQLADKQLIKLSNGETKRLLIAAALLKHPALLLLDNPLIGLDVQTRAEFNGIIAEIAASGVSIIIATSPTEIPNAITHVAIMYQCKIESVMHRHAFRVNMVKINSAPKIDESELKSLLNARPIPAFTNIVKMENVSIRYGRNIILNNVSWQIRQGERWALLGPNGSGKSTLLSLINGDNPQAYANHIELFDRKRGSGESIWDIKNKTGFVSPELYQCFPAESTCLQVIESGFYDTLGLFRTSNPQKVALALRWMRLLEIEADARKLLKNVSASTQRLCLLARALVKNPVLLIFDEPCQGLDSHQQQHFKHLTDAICSLGNTTLIYVSHYTHEIPHCVDHILRLDKGQRVA